MTPLSPAVVELRLVVDRAASRLPDFRRGASLEDFRTDTVADLLDAMDRIDPYLGTKLMLVLYPHSDAQFGSTLARHTAAIAKHSGRPS